MLSKLRNRREHAVLPEQAIQAAQLEEKVERLIEKEEKTL